MPFKLCKGVKVGHARGADMLREKVRELLTVFRNAGAGGRVLPDEFLCGLDQNWRPEKPGGRWEFGPDRGDEACSIVPRVNCEAPCGITSAHEQGRNGRDLTVDDGTAHP